MSVSQTTVQSPSWSSRIIWTCVYSELCVLMYVLCIPVYLLCVPVSFFCVSKSLLCVSMSLSCVPLSLFWLFDQLQKIALDICYIKVCSPATAGPRSERTCMWIANAVSRTIVCIFWKGRGWLRSGGRKTAALCRQTSLPASQQPANQVAAAASRSDEITFQTEQNPGQAGAGGHKHNI